MVSSDEASVGAYTCIIDNFVLSNARFHVATLSDSPSKLVMYRFIDFLTKKPTPCRPGVDPM